ncbi:G2/mitotic-specific cyclin S13-7-like [Lotus japonicus]|uniref:G2/mitotic-specific cyclin S13-7-like n=1 Tax=Lotus japonicus TaxID=34305 RepID=UPI002589EEAD|nr:G2/mitotic-specific cyclin S13-7-like [Lotus japonicus]
MASRPNIVPQQGKEERNRVILGDIGNLEAAREVEIKTNFCDQPLTNAQAATESNKVACGLTKKPNEQIVDNIDAGDVDNELAVVEYIEDIYNFYRRVENERRPNASYMESQPEIDQTMRAILVDWVIEVHVHLTRFHFSIETLYLTINIIDRFLSLITVPMRELQLVGVTAMLMASKYENNSKAPDVNFFVELSDETCSHEQILSMEKIILKKLEWNLSVPTPFVFLVRFIKASSIRDPDEAVENMAHFLCELGMMHYATLQYCPSMIASSAVFAARCTLNKSPSWNHTLEMHTGYSQQQLMDCATLLVSFHCRARNGKHKAVLYNKYSNPERGAVVMLPPAQNLVL